MSEKFLGIILWADRDGARGVLADTAGQTWHFTETIAERGTFNRIPVYENGWRPKVFVLTNSRTDKEFVTTEAEIVEFEIEFFQYKDGRDGHKITRICAPDDFSQEDAEKLFIVRENWECQKSAERRERILRHKNEMPNLGYRTRCYR